VSYYIYNINTAAELVAVAETLW